MKRREFIKLGLAGVSAMTCVAPQDPKAAAKEIERCMQSWSGLKR